MNMKVKEEIPMVVSVLRAVPRALLKDLEELEIRGRIKTIKTTALLKLTRKLRRVLETCYRSTSLQSQWVEAGMKILQVKKIMIIMILTQGKNQTWQAKKFTSIHDIQSKTNNLRQKNFVEINRFFLFQYF